MSDFAARIASLEGAVVETVTGKPFTVTAVTATQVIVTLHSTGKTFGVDLWRIDRAAALKLDGELLRPSAVKAAGISPRNKSYVAAIVNALT